MYRNIQYTGTNKTIFILNLYEHPVKMVKHTTMCIYIQNLSLICMILQNDIYLIVYYHNYYFMFFYSTFQNE